LCKTLLLRPSTTLQELQFRVRESNVRRSLHDANNTNVEEGNLTKLRLVKRYFSNLY